MHALMIPFGTAGDVHPFLGVARVLRQRGHRVTVVTDTAFEELTRREGLEFETLSKPEESADLMHHPDLWHPTRSYPLIFRSLVAPKIKSVFELIRGIHIPEQTVIVASNLALGARVAAEKLHLPMVSLYVSPMSLPSFLHPPPLPGIDLFPGRPHAWLKFLFALADWRVGRLLGASLHALCREQALRPPKQIMKWWHSPQSIIGLFPEWFASREEPWPAHVQFTGFPLYDTGSSITVPDDLEAFLQSGAPPVVFMPSSSMAQAADFLRESVEACVRLGRRGILLTQFPAQLPANLPAGVRSFPFVPLSRLLPRSAAIVHQGGIGTIALSLAAGIPQLAVPMGMDQHANAERLIRLGTGVVVKAKHYRADRVAILLKELTTSDTIRRACQDASKRFVNSHPSEDACDLIEGVFKKHSAIAAV